MRTNPWLLLIVLSGCGLDAEDDELIAEAEPVARIVGWGAPQRLTSVASSYTETDPAISEDGLELFFVSDRRSIFFQRPFRIYRSVRLSLDDTWSPPVEVSALWPEDGVFTEDINDSGPDLSRDNLTIWFSRKTEDGPSRLFTSTRPHRSMAWSTPTLVAGLESTNATAPNVSADGQTLYFTAPDTDPVSNKGLEIYKATQLANGSWGNIRAIPRWSTAYAEDSLTTARGDREAYFVSTRGGDWRVWRSTRTLETTWSAPEVVEDLPIGNTRPDVTGDALDMVITQGGDLYEVRR